jgi:transglutaminase-like putative cysteine protease
MHTLPDRRRELRLSPLEPCPRTSRRRVARGAALFAAGAALATAGLPGAALSARLGVYVTAAARPPAAPSGGGAGAAGGEPWDGRFMAAPAAEVLRAAAAVPAGDDAVSVLFFEVGDSIDPQGRLTRTLRVVYRVNSASADASWSVVSQTWHPWHQSEPRMRARVVTTDGQEHLLDPGVLSRSDPNGSDPEMFADTRGLRGPLPAVGPGAVVEREVVVADTAPLFDQGTVDTVPMAAGGATVHARVIVETPAGVPVRYAVELLPGVVPRRESAGGRVRLTFEARDLAAVSKSPPGTPPEAPRWPAVVYSTAGSWTDVARRYSEIVDQAAAGADLAAWLRAAGADQPAGSQVELIERLLPRLRDIRYTGVELGAAGIVPRSPAETLGRRFGDCKDKALLLVAALRSLDIPAYVALLAAGRRDANPALPGFGAFNHAIVFVPGAAPLWIDPTDPHARLGELPAADQDRYALVAAPSSTALVRTPASVAADNTEVKTREIYLADAGPARIVETTEDTGEAERWARAHYLSLSPEALRKELTSYANVELAAKDAPRFEHSAADDLRQPFRRRLEIARALRGYTGDADAQVAIFYGSLLYGLPSAVFDAAGDDGEAAAAPAGVAPAGTKAPPRTADFYFRFPNRFELRYRIVPPAGFAPDGLPASRVRQLGPATLSETYTLGDGGSVTAVLRLDTGPQRISPAQFAELCQAVQPLTQDKTVVSFRQVGETEAAAGHLREALREFAREAAAAPGKALPHVRTARTLLAAGLGDAARREAELALRLEPGSAVAHATLGWVLQHDAIGRRFGRGYPHSRALAEYAKAKQLDPSLAAVRANYAILLEHDSRGVRYAPGADLAAAITELQSLRRDLDDHRYDENLLLDLLYARRFAEVLELAGTLKESPLTQEAWVTATAITAGPEAALRGAMSKSTDNDSRFAVLKGAAASLMQLRAFDAAATLFDRAGSLSSDATAALATAAILRQVRPLAAIPLPADQPDTVVRKLLIAMADDTQGPDSFTDLFSERVVSAEARRSDANTRILAEMREALEAQTLQQGMSLDLALEIGLAGMRVQVSGGDTAGYRLDMQAGPVNRLQLFVVAEAGTYRIAAFASFPESLAQEALRRLDAHDSAGARQWLDWARDAVGEPAGALPTPPLAALWSRGAPADDALARCAAAALDAESEPAIALPILLACRAAATTDDRRLALDLALAQAYRAAERWRDLADTAQRLAVARPEADLPFELQVTAAERLAGRYAGAAAIAQERHTRLPDDVQAADALVWVDESEGRLDSAEQRLRQLLAKPAAGAAQINELAWLLLVRGRADDQAVDLAQRAAQKAADPEILHTLASLLAERNRPKEAYQVILQCINARKGRLAAPNDWYVFGRIAEQLDLPDVARGFYGKVERPEPPNIEAVSTYHLARLRLAALGAAPAVH